MPVGSIIGGIIGAGGASAAGSAAGAAGSQAYQNAQTERARNWANISPWVSVGAEASNRLAQLYGLGHLDGGAGDKTFGGQSLVTKDRATDQGNALAAFTTSPGYQFRLGEGVKALDRSAASKGLLLSGAQAKGVTDYGQNTASNEWGNYIQGLNALSGSGLSGTLGVTNTNAGILNTGNSLNFQGEMGRASSYSNAANALASGIGRGIQNLGSLVGFNPYGVFGKI